MDDKYLIEAVKKDMDRCVYSHNLISEQHGFNRMCMYGNECQAKEIVNNVPYCNGNMPKGRSIRDLLRFFRHGDSIVEMF